MILGCSYRFADEEAVLCDSPPCYPRSLCWGNGRKGLVTAQEGKEVEVVVRGIGSASEVRGRCGDNAGILRIGWEVLSEVYWGCSNGLRGVGRGEWPLPRTSQGLTIAFRALRSQS